MKKSLILFVKCFIPVTLYLAVSTATGLLITPLFGIDLSHAEMAGQKESYTGLFTVALIQTLVLTLVAHRSRLGGKSLAFLLSALFFVINNVLNIMESLIFMRNIFPAEAQMVILLNGLILSLVLGFTISGLWRSAGDEKDDPPQFNWSRKLILPWIGWTLIWFIIYFCAGFLIPMNVSGVSEYYFSREGAMDMALVPVGYIMQIPRSALWILLAIALQKYQKGSNWEKALITGILFGTLMSSELLVPNYLMPPLVRMAHLPEIMYANLLWGVIISFKVNRHFAVKEIFHN